MIPGSPPALHAAAHAIEAAARAGTAAPQGVQSARATALGGWSGDAADAFGDSASKTVTSLEGFLQTVSTVVAPITTYATELQAAQLMYAAAITPAEKAAAVAMAQAANAAAAGQIQGVHTAQESAQDTKTAIKGTSIATGLGLGGARAWQRYQAANATKIVTQWRAFRGTVVPEPIEVADKAAAARFTAVAKGLRGTSFALAPVFAGAGQWAGDSANPSLTTAQRVGRTTAQAVTVGGASILGSVAAGALAGSVLPGPGTVVGAVGGLVAGTVGSLGAGYLMDKVNDGVVDWAGNAAQHVSDWAGGVADRAGKALDAITPW